MSTLLPGFPAVNLILAGIAAIEQGQDLEQALARRDAKLTQPVQFMQATWEALAWLVPESPFAQALAQQAQGAWERLTPIQRGALRGGWSKGPQTPHQALALVQWGAPA